MNKRQRFIYEHKKEIIAYAILIFITVLLCIPFTLGYAVRVFGWIVWAYLAVAYFLAIMHSFGKRIRLTKQSLALLIVSSAFIISTLHVACFNRVYSETFTQYILGAYEKDTVGGVIFAIITGPVVVYCTYAAAIAIFMVGAAILSFLFIRPFVFQGKGNPFETVNKKTKKSVKDCKEVLIDNAPFLSERPVEKAPVPYYVNEEERKCAEARKLLFGKYDDEDEEEEEEQHKNVFDESYNNKKYGLINHTITHPVDFQLGKKEPDAAQLLFGDEKKDKESVLNDELNYSDEQIIFDSDVDVNIFKAQPEGTITETLKQRVNDSYKYTVVEYAGEEKRLVKDEDNIPPKTDISDEVNELFNKYSEDILSNLEETDYTDYDDEDMEEYDEEEEEKPVELIKRPQAPVYREEERPIIRPAPRVVTPPPSRPESTLIEEEPKELCMSNNLVVSKRPQVPYKKPPISLLQEHKSENFNPEVENWEELKEVIEVKLQYMGIKATLVSATKGPTTTLCAIRLDDRCPIAKLFSIQRDLQRWLRSSTPIAIQQQIPGTDYCGIQIPNAVRGIVGFKEVISSREYREAKGDIVIAFGKTAEGEIYTDDLAAMPHALVAGETGSGKSVCLNVILASILFRYSPEEVKLVLIDLKLVEMELYSGLPHMLLREPLSDPDEIVNALKWIRQEVENRFIEFKNLHFRNLSEYNRNMEKKLPRIVIIIDEASELMENPNVKKVLEETLGSLARVARAAGVHLIFATQNPVRTVITSEIQNNLNTKIAFAVSDYNHSQVILKAKGAECLLGKGDMLSKKGQEMIRAQCAFVDGPELQLAVDYIKKNNEYSFNMDEIAKILKGNSNEESKIQTTSSVNGVSYGGGNADSESTGNGNGPDLYWQALKICVDSQYVSCSYLQRKLKKGYNTIANVLEELADDGHISRVPQGSKEKREILISKEDFEVEWKKRFGTYSDGQTIENFD